VNEKKEVHDASHDPSSFGGEGDHLGEGYGYVFPYGPFLYPNLCPSPCHDRKAKAAGACGLSSSSLRPAPSFSYPPLCAAAYLSPFSQPPIYLSVPATLHALRLSVCPSLHVQPCDAISLPPAFPYRMPPLQCSHYAYREPWPFCSALPFWRQRSRGGLMASGF
jgi:hypothetical protein